MVHRMWADDAGFVVATELTVVAAILVIGLLVGLVSVRDQVLQEIGDVAAAVTSLNMEYAFAGITGHTSSSAGSEYADQGDSCDGPLGNDLEGEAPVCIAMFLEPEIEN